MDANTGSYYLDRNGTPKTVNGNTIQVGPGDFGNGLITFKVNGINTTI